MILALNGLESDLDAFVFVLAEKLHKTVGEVESMPRSEYLAWQHYTIARGMQAEVSR